MKKWFFLVLAISGFSCSNDEPDNGNQGTNIERRDVILTTEQTTLMDRQIDFAFNLFEKEVSGSETENRLLSPVSVSVALSMLANGADGETLSELLEVLGAESLTDLNTYNKLLKENLYSLDNKVRISMAQSIWLKNTFTPLQNYIDILKTNYNSDVYSFDNDAHSTISRINSWCSEKTGGMIPEFLNDIPSSDVMLFNATAFDGKWARPFDIAATKQSSFFNAGSTPVHINMMNATWDNLYYETNEYQALRLPYGNSAYNMTIILPTENNNPATLISKLAGGEWNTCKSSMTMHEVKLSVPKFNLYTSNNLVESLTGLNINKAFSTDGEYPKISQSEVLFNIVKHDVFIDVNESGTKASSVTMIGGITDSGIPQRTMHVDHPFVFVIDETSTGAILFMGAINRL